MAFHFYELLFDRILYRIIWNHLPVFVPILHCILIQTQNSALHIISHDYSKKLASQTQYIDISEKCKKS